MGSEIPDRDDAAHELPPGVVTSLETAGWRREVRPPWVHIRPATPVDLIQGWKLHISATVISAPRVLAACAPVLVAAGCEFKFAVSTQALREFNDTRAPRGMSGKFLTAYPVDEDQLRLLAEQLDAVTRCLDGPRILSDARLRPDSLVHYRYGAFLGVRVLGNDGSYSNQIIAPDGVAVPDRREAFFSPPPWATSPFATSPAGPRVPAPTGTPSSAPAAVLLNGRYRVSTAIRHANKGGVYLAEDADTGSTVVIKEGRPHVATDDYGRDARDVVRHEAQVLDQLVHLGWTPRLVEVFEAQGHVFLVEEQVPGTALVRWVEERLNQGDPLDLGQWWALAEQLTRMLGDIHSCGVIVRDLSPNNVMIDEDASLRLIDLELAHLAGEAHPIYEWGGTPGSSAPEQFRGAAPTASADVYSLGATLLFLATALNPEVLRDTPDQRSLDDLILARLEVPKLPFELPPPLVRLVRWLMTEEPPERPTVPEIAAVLAAQRPRPGIAATDLWRRPTTAWACTYLRALPPEHWDELVDGIVGHLSATVNEEAGSRLWRSTAFGDETEPCAVQYGVGGVLAVLCRLHRCRPAPEVDRLLRLVHDRVVGHLRTAGHRLPGLYFGAAGTALAVREAGLLLDRPDSVQLAQMLLRDLPRRWPNADITHGAAGLGTALLSLWQATGEADLASLLAEVADGLVEAADPDESAATWTVPRDFDSQLAGYCSYGFAHGTAGIGAFLLAAGKALGRSDLTAMAQRCGQALAKLAVHRDESTVWHEGPDKPGFLTHWCNGSSGVGTFLVRLYAAGGKAEFLDLAERGARAVMRQRWRTGTAYCHGLAGDGDFLLDLAEASGDATHRAWAEEIACVLYDHRTYRDGRAVIPNETGQAVTAEFGSGLAGHLAFLLRLRHGGPRIFHPPLATLDRVGP